MRRPQIVALIVVVVAAAALIGRQLVTQPGPRTYGLPVEGSPDQGLPASSVPLPASGDSPLASVTIDYPAEGSIFPPDMTAPLFSWHDTNQTSAFWRIDVTFADGSADIRTESSGPPPQIGEIDPRCVAVTNQLPKLTPDERTLHTWRPDEKTWTVIQRHAVKRPATVTIASVAGPDHRVSRGRVTIQVSEDAVGAPIFYRDVPLMPTETSPGVVSPLAKDAFPLIQWRLRHVAEPRSRLLLQDMPTCANCHSFSRDGKTLGMDLDGPQNDKSLYAFAPIAPQMTIRNQDLIRWDSYKNEPKETQKGIGLRYGFMSQVSPDGNYVVTTLNSQIYVVNFADYRFLQVFYPTRGILAWYSKATGRIQPLPGADDPHYVHAGNAWSPDGKYLIFSRAEAKDPYPEGRPMAKAANDPNEFPIQYDLYRIPFNAGKGGRAEPIAGASQNGMSNSFGKVSPDGRWIVFVQCRNGFLMRPDSQLFVVPAEGGRARRMRCNTPLMNSWHSFSPNGRWLVFSSKSRGPYTKMFLTHLDTQGNDSPAILIENSTAANRAVNIPEFVNTAADGFLKIDVPAAEAYRHYNLAAAEMKTNSRSETALAELRKTLEIDPQFSRAHNNLGSVLAARGQIDEAIAECRKALEIDPNNADAHNNLAGVLAGRAETLEAIAEYRKALEIRPDFAEAHKNLGVALAARGQVVEAISHYRKAVEIKPNYADAYNNLGIVLAGRGGERDEAIAQFQKALEIEPDYAEAHYNLGSTLAERGQVDEAIIHFQKALEIKPDYVEAHNNLGGVFDLKGRLDEAIVEFQKALKIKPDNAGTSRNLALAQSQRERTLKALGQRREAIRSRPDDVALLNDVAWMLATNPNASVRNGREAIELALRAWKLSGGKKPTVLGTLAAAYAEAGRFPEAVQTARKAIDLAKQQNEPAVAESIRAKIRFYEAGTAFREPPPSPL
ncbi:MAG: tetratricopeptide repeat protein [Thermoguttaceae bacterium]